METDLDIGAMREAFRWAYRGSATGRGGRGIPHSREWDAVLQVMDNRPEAHFTEPECCKKVTANCPGG